MSAFATQSWLGSHMNSFEACTTFTCVTAYLVARSPEVTRLTEGSDGFVTSTAAPVATGWNDPVAGWDLHPRDLPDFSRRTLRSVTRDNRGGRGNLSPILDQIPSEYHKCYNYKGLGISSRSDFARDIFARGSKTVLSGEGFRNSDCQ
jgi:hypothetical protein